MNSNTPYWIWLQSALGAGARIKEITEYFGGVKEVYAHVMSDEAIRALAENGIQQQCDVSVKNIINRAGTGICPMEEATREISDPKEALQAIKQRLTELKSRT